MGRLAPNGTPVVVQTGASIIVEDEQGRIWHAAVNKRRICTGSTPAETF